MTSTLIRSAAPAAALLAMALAGCSGLGSDGRLREDPLGNIEQRLIGDTLTGLGIAAPQRERIDYSPRAPLAMPPRAAAAQLPQPQAPVTAQAPANWPRDPDVVRREAAQREASRPRDYNWERERDGRRMTVEEMEAQRNAGPQIASRGPNEPFRERNVVLQRDELERGWTRPEAGNSIFSVDETVDMTRGRQEEGQGAARRYLDEQSGGPGGGNRGTARLDTSRLASQQQEPPRRSLADPPTGMRTPAPDPTGGAITTDDRQNYNLFERLFGAR